MNMNNRQIRQLGIGLIEVLIATVVIALGLMAVAALQGGLINGSRDNKTRAEALALANSKIEQLRDTITIQSYDSLISNSNETSIGGVNESFKRTWTVNTQTNPKRKEVTVAVCWPSANCTDNVNVKSVIAFDTLTNSIFSATGNTTSGSPIVGGPSANAESSDEITETKDVPDDAPGTYIQDTANQNKIWIRQNARTRAIAAYTCSSLSLTDFENGLKTRRVDFDGNASTGAEAIELYETIQFSNTDYCIPRIRYNGGVIIPIRGIVHSGATTGNGQNQQLLDVDLFTFNASETGAFCVFNPGSNAKSAPYVCYVGGNCSNFTGTTSTSVTSCPSGAAAAAKVGPGGWRGKVGLLGVAGPSNNFKNVCFQEEINGTPATLDTSRNYYARHNNNNEGINKPYSCHDFLIINGQTTEEQVHRECLAQANAIGGFRLASKTIQREIATTNNEFDPLVDQIYCASGNSYTVTGNIVNANALPVVTINDNTTPVPCTVSNNNTSYACSITTSATSLTVTGVYNSETESCTINPASNNGCTLTFTPSPNPVYTISGNIVGSTASIKAVTITPSGGGSCTNNLNGTYTCSLTFPTNIANVALTASITSGGTVSPSSDQTVTLSGATSSITGPTFTASGLYTVSGSIAIGNQINDLTTVTVAVETNTGSCTLTGSHQPNTSDTYSCTVRSGANNLTIAMSPACSTGGGSKKYRMTDGTTTTLGSGQLVIPLNITSDITKNITTVKTSTNC